jgi:hypothetical protein
MLQMTLGDIEKNYCEAKDRKTQIGILADLNGVESTFMAMLLREMGIDVDAMKLPRKPRNGGADAYELFQLTPEYAEAVKYREEHGREIGRAIGYHANEGGKMENTEKVKCKEIKPVGAPEGKEYTNEALRMAIYMWGAYMEYRYGTTATKEDMEMLERLIGITSGK